MNIWIINQHAKPLDGVGGTRHAVICKYLSRLGHTITVFASYPVDSGRQVKDGALYEDRDFEGYRFRYVRIPFYRNVVERFYSMFVFRKNVLRATEGLSAPDVVIGSSVHLHAADAGRRLAEKHKVPFLFEIRDIWPQTLVDIGGLNRRNPVYWHLRRLELRLMSSADKIISLLPGAVQYLKEHNVPDEKIFYFPNGIDPEMYPDSNDPEDEQDEFLAMFFGAHGNANGLDNILRAAKVLQDRGNERIRIQMIGNGPAKAGLMILAGDMDLKNLEFLDSMPKEELFTYAGKASCFIFNLKRMKVLSRYGISANKLFDYLMLQRPVIFACESYNNPVEEARAGISVEPQNPEQMAEALLELSHKSNAERMEMGKNGRQWVMENHNFRKYTGMLEEMMKGMIN